jgi:uroporphyrinogen-III synthase
MLPLHGIGVLVTRPEQQALPLCRLLEAQGAASHRFPAIDVKEHAGRGALVARLGPAEDFDLIIFVSANAVKFGHALLQRRQGVTLAALGPATARALEQAGYPVAVLPSRQFDSEGLLAHPRLASLAGRRVLLVKGSGGRDLLAQELRRRGALLEIAEVYLRVRAAPSEAELAALEALLQGGAVQVITATSLEIAGHLLGMATPILRREFDRVHWLVPSSRTAQGVRDLGLRAPLLQAASAEAHDLLASLLRWRSSVSGA